MSEEDLLAKRFDDHRDHLRAVAYRMLGSLTEAEDAVQEAWLRLSRADSTEVENLGGWLTTVVGRVCLDMLRSRKSRREEPAGDVPAPVAATDPEEEAVLADSVGLALLVVLNTLDPAERLAFVLHDLFALPFNEIAPIVGRSPAAARQLASRARRRIQGGEITPDVARQREVVEAFRAAARGGDFEALLTVLDPDVVRTTDGPGGELVVVRGAAEVASGAVRYSRGALAGLALINGEVGLISAPHGKLAVALRFTVAGDRVTELDVVSSPDRLNELDITVLEPAPPAS